MSDDANYIRFACGFCSKSLKVPPEYSGRRVTCNGCGNSLRVPGDPKKKGAADVYKETFFEPDDETIPALVNPSREPARGTTPPTPVVKERSQYRGCVSSAFLWAALLWSIATLYGCFIHVRDVANRVDPDSTEDFGLRIIVAVGIWGAIWFFPWMGAIVFSVVTKKN